VTAPNKTVTLLEGRIGATMARIVLEYTVNGGRQVIYRLGDHDVTREAFIVASKLASALAEERCADLLTQILTKLP